MEIDMICVGYVGGEAFDLVLYIGRTLTKLNYRVLIIDLSDSTSLLETIKHGMELNSSEGIINYRDINYTRKIPTKEDIEIFEHGVIFVVYGSNYIESEIFECMTMNIIVNTFPSIIENVNILMQKGAWCAEKFKLLIRDIITLDDIDRVKKEVHIPYEILSIDYLYLEIADYENAVECQRSQIVRFTKITSHMEKYIIEQIHEMFPALTSMKIKKAITAAKKGV